MFKLFGNASVCRYVHNNIFFSFAVDGDFNLMQQMRDQNLHTDGTVGEKQATSNGDVHLDNVKEGQSDASSNAEADAAAAVVESEQATYASANNDLKGTKAYNSVDVSGLHTLAMAIIDYRGHRVVAQVGFRYCCTFSLFKLDKAGSHFSCKFRFLRLFCLWITEYHTWHPSRRQDGVIAIWIRRQRKEDCLQRNVSC